ncbi:MAG: entericidin A/B family lipoprotein [Alphaproteobacteria bacterium]|nr:entericidin A/B family lipoprotein [Alphaproteobacteria bacterium]
MKSLLALLITGLAALSLTACNTIQGVGQDLQRAGEALEEATE